MAPELGTAVAAEADLAKLASIGIAIGAVVFLLGRHLFGTLVRAAWLVAALVVGQIVVANHQALVPVLEAGKSVLADTYNQQNICELYAADDSAANLACRSGLKGTLD